MARAGQMFGRKLDDAQPQRIARQKRRGHDLGRDRTQIAQKARFALRDKAKQAPPHKRIDRHPPVWHQPRLRRIAHRQAGTGDMDRDPLDGDLRQDRFQDVVHLASLAFSSAIVCAGRSGKAAVAATAPQRRKPAVPQAQFRRKSGRLRAARGLR